MTKFFLLFLAMSAFATETAAQTFHGDTCTSDCSGHEAGYEWAEEQGITDPESCDGNSNSFIEGCQAWAEEQQGGANEDEDLDEE